jgi:hypothetical protein
MTEEDAHIFSVQAIYYNPSIFYCLPTITESEIEKEESLTGMLFPCGLRSFY